MIKRIIACLTICLIITGLISPVFSNASALPQPNWSDPGISEIINISDLTGWMLNGGTYDVSTYTDAESFMNDYYAARTKTRLEGADYEVKSSFGLEQQYYQLGDSAYAHPLDVNRVISSSFRDHSGYGRRLSNEVNDALLSSGNLYDTKIPLLNEVEFANFVGYNHDALRLYSEFFDNEPDTPTPNPDPYYASYISRMNENNNNGIDFFWSNLSGATSASYCIYDTTTNNNIINRAWDTRIMQAFDILNIYITGNGNSWSFTVSDFNFHNFFLDGNNSYPKGKCMSPNNTLSAVVSLGSSSYNMAYKVSSGGPYASLDICFSNISSVFRNVNIYVNGELWALVGGSTVTPHITPEFPDAVGGEELPNTTWPISRPRAPYYTSVPGVLQAIEDAIQGDGELDIDDLKPYLTDANGDPVPDPIFDPEPIPIPVPDPVNPDIVPGLPELPVIPLDMPGFNGVSVLAEIINFTNQSLPNALIVTFWGIVFGIVILGLIKILHK